MADARPAVLGARAGFVGINSGLPAHAHPPGIHRRRGALTRSCLNICARMNSKVFAGIEAGWADVPRRKLGLSLS